MNTVHNRVPWINLAVGIMTIIGPYALGTSDTATKWSLVITGIVIAIVAIIELAMDASNRSVSYWPIVNIIAGIWLLISTSMAAGNPNVIWNDVFLGVTAIITAIVAMSYERMGSGANTNVSHRA